jgi:hypothetical protein
MRASLLDDLHVSLDLAVNHAGQRVAFVRALSTRDSRSSITRRASSVVVNKRFVARQKVRDLRRQFVVARRSDRVRVFSVDGFDRAA